MTNPYERNWRMPGVPRDESPARSRAAGAFREPFDLQRGPHDPSEDCCGCPDRRGRFGGRRNLSPSQF